MTYHHCLGFGAHARALAAIAYFRGSSAAPSKLLETRSESADMSGALCGRPRRRPRWLW